TIRTTGVDGQTVEDTFDWPSPDIGGGVLTGKRNFPLPEREIVPATARRLPPGEPRAPGRAPRGRAGGRASPVSMVLERVSEGRRPTLPPAEPQRLGPKRAERAHGQPPAAKGAERQDLLFPGVLDTLVRLSAGTPPSAPTHAERLE